MPIVRNRLVPSKNYDAISVLGVLPCRKGTTIMADLIQHERIHTRQMIELGFVFFYLFYIIEWLVRLPVSGRAYLNISFEREAYRHTNDPNYLFNRRLYAQMRYLKNPSRSRTKSPKKPN